MILSSWIALINHNRFPRIIKSIWPYKKIESFSGNHIYVDLSLACWLTFFFVYNIILMSYNLIEISKLHVKTKNGFCKYCQYNSMNISTPNININLFRPFFTWENCCKDYQMCLSECFQQHHLFLNEYGYDDNV